MAKKQEFGLVLLTQESNTSDIITALDSAIKSIKEIETTPWKSQGYVDFGNGTTIDLKTEQKIDTLIKAFSVVQSKETAYNKAVETLALDSAPIFSICGANTEAFLHDVRLRIMIIQQDSKLNKLKAAKEKMALFMTQAEQRALALKEIESILGLNK